MSRRLRLKSWHRKKRYAIRQNTHMDRVYRALVGAVGTAMILFGIALIPLPTPGFGWLLVFLGLGVLSTEFAWAHRITAFLRLWLHRIGHWYGRRSVVEKTAMISAIVVLVVGLAWVFGFLGIFAGWVHLDHAWLQGPIGH